ncbi:MAG: DUF4177 domain-containing protein [Bacteroidia bacterium]
MKYEYEVVSFTASAWTGRFTEDYLKIINERGQDGWRFVGFIPTVALPKGAKGNEALFERRIDSSEPKDDTQ